MYHSNGVLRTHERRNMRETEQNLGNFGTTSPQSNVHCAVQHTLKNGKNALNVKDYPTMFTANERC